MSTPPQSGIDGMKRLYNVEVRLSSGSWHAHLSCQCVGLERARGIVTGIGLAYPCPDRRMLPWNQGVGPNPLSACMMARIVKRAAEAAGIEGDFSGLSLRAGFATSAAEAGLSVPDIMRQTGHKKPETVMRYIRHNDVWNDNPAERIGL